MGWELLLRISVIAWLATMVDSLIGSELQPQLPWLSNEAVNALMTTIAAATAMVVLR